jgi:hypothetical protein
MSLVSLKSVPLPRTPNTEAKAKNVRSETCRCKKPAWQTPPEPSFQQRISLPRLRKVPYADLPRRSKTTVSVRGPSVFAHTGVSLYPLHHCRRSVVHGVNGRPGTATDIGRRQVVDYLTRWCAMVANSFVAAPSGWLGERLRGYLSFLLWRRRTRRAGPTAESDIRYRPLH